GTLENFAGPGVAYRAGPAPDAGIDTDALAMDCRGRCPSLVAARRSDADRVRGVRAPDQYVSRGTGEPAVSVVSDAANSNDAGRPAPVRPADAVAVGQDARSFAGDVAGGAIGLGGAVARRQLAGRRRRRVVRAARAGDRPRAARGSGLR